MLRNAEYPHTVTFMQQERTSDGGGGFIFLWKAKFMARGFLDTPSSREVFEAQQLNNPLDRNLYYPFRTDMRANREQWGHACGGGPDEMSGIRAVRVPGA